MFVLEYAREHQNLLPTWMAVGVKHRARRPTHQS